MMTISCVFAGRTETACLLRRFTGTLPSSKIFHSILTTKLQDMAKIKSTPALKKTAQRVSTGKKTTPKPTTPKKHGEKRKLHINEVVLKLNQAIKDVPIPGVDNIVPKLIGICKFNQQIIKDLLNDAQQQHIGNQVAEELFFTALKIEHYAKETLRRVMIKSKKTDQEDVDFLNQVFRIDADFFCKVEPYVKRAYKKSKTSDKKLQQDARRVSQLEILVGDQERQMRAIYKRIPKLAAKVKSSKKVYFKATADFRKEYPIEDQDDIESVQQYEKWLNENTAKERGAWEAEKKLLKAKEKEYKTLQGEVEKHKKELQDSSELAEYDDDSKAGGDDELDYNDPDDDASSAAATPVIGVGPSSSSSDSDSDSSEEQEEEDETALSQTQREDLAKTLMNRL